MTVSRPRWTTSTGAWSSSNVSVREPLLGGGAVGRLRQVGEPVLQDRLQLVERGRVVRPEISKTPARSSTTGAHLRHSYAPKLVPTTVSPPASTSSSEGANSGTTVTARW